MDVIRRSDEQGFPSIRVVQAAYHNRFLALSTKLGFNTVEPLSQIQGSPLNVEIERFNVRKMKEDDVEKADAVSKLFTVTAEKTRSPVRYKWEREWS